MALDKIEMQTLRKGFLHMTTYKTLRELAEKATPGPWCLGEIETEVWKSDDLRKIAYCGPKLDYAHGMTQSRANAEYIVALANSLPAIARRMRLLEEVAKAVQQLDLAYARQDRDIDGYVQRVRDTLKPLKEDGYGRD